MVRVMERKAYTIQEVAGALGVSARTIKRRLMDGSIRSFKLGRRRLVSAKQLDNLVNRGKARNAC